MPPPRTGTVSPAGTAPDGSPLFSARIRLGDGTRTRLDVPTKYKALDARRAFAASERGTGDDNTYGQAGEVDQDVPPLRSGRDGLR